MDVKTGNILAIDKMAETKYPIDYLKIHKRQRTNLLFGRVNREQFCVKCTKIQ